MVHAKIEAYSSYADIAKNKLSATYFMVVLSYLEGELISIEMYNYISNRLS